MKYCLTSSPQILAGLVPRARGRRLYRALTMIAAAAILILVSTGVHAQDGDVPPPTADNAAAQSNGATTATAENPLPPVRVDSPRATMITYIKAMKDYRIGLKTNDKLLLRRVEDAVACMNISGFSINAHEKGKRVAKQLQDYIDRSILLDFSMIPDADYAKSKWELKNTRISLKKQATGDWLFSKDTVDNASVYYEATKHLPFVAGIEREDVYQASWVETYIPDWAMKVTFVYPNWQWIGLFLAILFGLVIKTITQHIVRGLSKVTGKSKNLWDDKIVAAVQRPSGYVVACVFWLFAIRALHFEGAGLNALTLIVQLLFCISAIWIIYRLTDVVTEYFASLAAKTDSALDDHLVPLVRKALKIFVVIFGVLITCQNMGIQVMSLVAGLGLGGLAFALAAKDTCANFFGSIKIFIDRPFQIGDWIIVGAIDGNVEEIGFLSTRIRTFYNSQITVPNAVMANANIDNMGRREYRRIKAYLGLTYDTPPEKLEAFLEGVKNIVKANPYTRKDYYHVVFNSYDDYCLSIMLYCFLKVPDWSTELVERQNIYLEIYRLADALGVDFAFPTQTLHMESFPEKTSLRAPHDVDVKKLADTAREFGVDGSKARPSGQGLFTPPYKEDVEKD